MRDKIAVITHNVVHFSVKTSDKCGNFFIDDGEECDEGPEGNIVGCCERNCMLKPGAACRFDSKSYAVVSRKWVCLALRDSQIVQLHFMYARASTFIVVQFCYNATRATIERHFRKLNQDKYKLANYSFRFDYMKHMRSHRQIVCYFILSFGRMLSHQSSASYLAVVQTQTRVNVA